MSLKKERGYIAESIAKEFLIKKNYTFLGQNYYSRYGEIDLIFLDTNDTICFIEVKFSKLKHINPLQKINSKKINKLFLTAITFLKKNNLEEKNIKFDIIVIISNDIKYYQNVILINENVLLEAEVLYLTDLLRWTLFFCLFFRHQFY